MPGMHLFFNPSDWKFVLQKWASLRKLRVETAWKRVLNFSLRSGCTSTLRGILPYSAGVSASESSALAMFACFAMRLSTITLYSASFVVSPDRKWPDCRNRIQNSGNSGSKRAWTRSAVVVCMASASNSIASLTAATLSLERSARGMLWSDCHMHPWGVCIVPAGCPAL
eukprot:10147775-Ditylum_brightwellii.AAC.1